MSNILTRWLIFLGLLTILGAIHGVLVGAEMYRGAAILGGVTMLWLGAVIASGLGLLLVRAKP